MTEVRTRHWTMAGTAALGLHAVAAMWTLQTPSPPAASPGGGAT